LVEGIILWDSAGKSCKGALSANRDQYISVALLFRGHGRIKVRFFLLYDEYVPVYSS
jgi:hypothetical protein